MHMSPPPQTTPQPPQFFGSLVTSRQPLGQHVSPTGQAGPPLQLVGWVHTPPTQVSPTGQARPHWLQFFGSVCVFVQPAAQHCSPLVQSGPPLQVGGVWQVPPTHVDPGPQIVPH